MLNKIQTTKKYIGKSEMTSGNAYKVTIKYNGNSCSMTFHDNYKNNSSKLDFVMCLLMDAQCYDGYTFEEFCKNFGYDMEEEKSYYPYVGRCKKSYAIYKACKRQYEKLHKLFNDEEIIELKKLLENY